jgi:hypothetical protein
LRIGLAEPVAEVAVDIQCRLRGFGSLRKVSDQTPQFGQLVEYVGLAGSVVILLVMGSSRSDCMAARLR